MKKKKKTKKTLSQKSPNGRGSREVTEAEVEKEFWRLVQSPYETVEVEYGADIHTSNNGRLIFLSSVS